MSNNTAQNGTGPTGHANANNTANPHASSSHSTLPDYESSSPTSSEASYLARSITNSDMSDPDYDLDPRMRALIAAMRAALHRMWRGTPQLRTRAHRRQLSEMGSRAVDIAYWNNVSFEDGWSQIVYEARLAEARRLQTRWDMAQRLQRWITYRQAQTAHGGLIAVSSLGMFSRHVSPPVSPVSSDGDLETEMEELEDMVIRIHPPPTTHSGSDADVDTGSDLSDEDADEYTHDRYILDLLHLYRSME